MTRKKIIPLNTDRGGCCPTLKTNYYKMSPANFFGHSKDGFKSICIMETIERNTPMKENDNEPLCIKQATKQGYIEVPQGAVFDMSYPESTTRIGRVQEEGQVSPTLMAGGEAPCHYEGKESTSYRIRKLTPRECFRLMGVTETDIDKIQQSGVSKTQQYKIAGNSIVVDVMYYIFKDLFSAEKGSTTNEEGQLSLF